MAARRTGCQRAKTSPPLHFDNAQVGRSHVHEIVRYFEGLGVLATLPITVSDVRRNGALMRKARRDDRTTSTILDLFRAARDAMVPEAAPTK